jgi:hypothetical protein
LIGTGGRKAAILGKEMTLWKESESGNNYGDTQHPARKVLVNFFQTVCQKTTVIQKSIARLKKIDTSLSHPLLSQAPFVSNNPDS